MIGGPRAPLALTCAALTCAALLSLARPAAAEYAVVVGGGWALLNIPPRPTASLVLIPGGDGELHIEPDGTFARLAGNQLVRTRKDYVHHGVATLTIDKAVKLPEAIAYLRQIARPVGVAASSRGSLRVPRALAGGPDALVLTSSFLEAVRLELKDAARLPRTLIVHHRDDQCWATPAADVEPFAVWGGAKVTVAWLSGGINAGDACLAQSNHGFNGLDAVVVRTIATYLHAP